MLGGLCLSGCCGDIGYESSSPWCNFDSAFGTPLGMKYIAGIGDDTSRLVPSIKVFFVGLSFTCGSVLTNSGNWQAYKDYLLAGGRIWINSEYGRGDLPGSTSQGTPAVEGGSGCLVNPATLNSFMSFVGSSIRWYGGIDDSGGSCNLTTAPCTAGPAAIAAGVTFKIALSAKITGGTVVWNSRHGIPVVAVQKVGNGFIFLCGDSNVSDCICFYNNQNFFTRLVTQADADVI